MNTSRYLLREAAVSAIINGLISTGFFVGAFGSMDPVPVWGVGNYAFDFIPQSFAVALMSALVPGFLARAAIKAGRFGARAVPEPRTIGIRAIVWAVAALVAGTAAATAVLWLSGVAAIGHGPAFAIKIAYGAALGAIVTHRSVNALIH